MFDCLGVVTVDGGWGTWGPWSVCISSDGICSGTNKMYRERKCDNPVKSATGADCSPSTGGLEESTQGECGNSGG